jgi:hypothetical protein
VYNYYLPDEFKRGSSTPNSFFKNAFNKWCAITNITACADAVMYLFSEGTVNNIPGTHKKKTSPHT